MGFIIFVSANQKQSLQNRVSMKNGKHIRISARNN